MIFPYNRTNQIDRGKMKPLHRKRAAFSTGPKRAHDKKTMLRIRLRCGITNVQYDAMTAILPIETMRDTLALNNQRSIGKANERVHAAWGELMDRGLLCSIVGVYRLTDEGRQMMMMIWAAIHKADEVPDYPADAPRRSAHADECGVGLGDDCSCQLLQVHGSEGNQILPAQPAPKQLV